MGEKRLSRVLKRSSSLFSRRSSLSLSSFSTRRTKSSSSSDSSSRSSWFGTAPKATDDNNDVDDTCPTPTNNRDEHQHQQQQTPYLLDRLGGEDALRTVIAAFYKRVFDDPQLQPFFEHANRTQIQHHQLRFFTIAFTALPKGYNVQTMIQSTHRRVFEMGVTQDHFDRIVHHLSMVLSDRGFHPSIIEEALLVLGPLRSAFPSPPSSQTTKQDQEEEEEEEHAKE